MTNKVKKSVSLRDALILNIAAIKRLSKVDGPGMRMTIWVQGCLKKCPGCINNNFLPVIPNKLIRVDALANYIIEQNEIEGISFSGGEPFEQAHGLVVLCEQIRQRRPELTYLAYSGYYLSELQQKNDPWVNRLLDHLDMLIDGPFVLAQKGNLKWRGSANQQVHFLSNRYSVRLLDEKETRTQVTINSNGKGSINGFGFDDDNMRTLKEILSKRGIDFEIKK